MNAGYFEHERSEVLALVDRPPRKALDVGCGAGAFARALKAAHRCEVWGVEPDERSACEARAHLDRVVIGFFEGVFESLAQQRFDAIFFNDVLEHMAYPETALTMVRRILEPGGRIYASIPNVLFAPHLLEVLRTRDWQYRDAGILDRTHLRFFTRKSIERMFLECGYGVERLTPLNALSTWKWRAANALSGGFLADLLAMQYGVVATVRQ